MTSVAVEDVLPDRRLVVRCVDGELRVGDELVLGDTSHRVLEIEGFAGPMVNELETGRVGAIRLDPEAASPRGSVLVAREA